MDPGTRRAPFHDRIPMPPPSPPFRRRVFTVAEANALLPHLEEVFRQVDGRRAELVQVGDRVQVLDLLWGEGVRSPSNPDHGELLQHQDATQRVLGEIEVLVRREVVSRGIRFPVGGLEHGILDFPSTWEGRWVYLCWRRGEARVKVWHEVDAGFAGRRPLTPEQEVGMGLEDPADLDDSLLDF